MGHVVAVSRQIALLSSTPVMQITEDNPARLSLMLTLSGNINDILIGGPDVSTGNGFLMELPDESRTPMVIEGAACQGSLFSYATGGTLYVLELSYSSS